MTNSYIERFYRFFTVSVIGLFVAGILHPVFFFAPFFFATVVVAFLWYPTETWTLVEDTVGHISVSMPTVNWWPVLYHGSAVFTVVFLGVLFAGIVLYLISQDRFQRFMRGSLDLSGNDPE